jgi:glutamate racemase
MTSEDLINRLKHMLTKNIGSGIVGVFDSGIGGLTLVDALESLPIASRIREIRYVGDTENFPYGTKSEVELQRLVMQRIFDLASKGAEYIAIACNTASIAFAKITEDKQIKSRVFGTVDCAVEYISQLPYHKSIGVIGTDYTVNSKAYETGLQKLGNVDVITSAEQLLVLDIERADEVGIERELNRVVNKFQNSAVDTFILGCTHYSHIKERFIASFGHDVEIVDPSVILANKLQAVSQRRFRGVNTRTFIEFTGNRPELAPAFKKYQSYTENSLVNVSAGLNNFFNFSL